MSRKMMRSVLAVLLALMLLVCFAACNDPADTTTATPDTTETPVTSTEPADETDPPEDTSTPDTDTEGTLPEDTLPEDTLPDDTLPDDTLPPETSETKPADTTTTVVPGEPHKHTYLKVEIAPTCEEGSYTLYTCACGESYEEPTGQPALGHQWKLNEGDPNNDPNLSCVQGGMASYTCTVCATTSVFDNGPLPHKLTVPAALVSKENDKVFGEGYEILACETCLYMERIVANHGDGHNFALQPDGTLLCQCGATATDSGVKNALRNEYTTGAVGNISFTGNVLACEKFWLSGTNGQTSLIVTNQDGSIRNETFRNVLDGYLNGDTVASSKLSFKLSYTGTAPSLYASANSDFLSWRSNGPNNSVIYEFSVLLRGTPEGKLALYNNKNTTMLTLESGVEYTLNFNLNAETNMVKITIDVPGESEPVDFLTISLQQPLSSLLGIWLGRSSFYHANESEFAFYLDDLSLDYVARAVDTTNVKPALNCAHDFEAVRYEDAEHPYYQGWIKYTCKNCNRYFYGQTCEAIGRTHDWEAQVVQTPATCVKEGVATRHCTICDVTEEVALPMQHDLSVFVAMAVAERSELWACSECNSVEFIEGNHKSGHSFGENGVCKCGAKIASEQLEVVTSALETESLMSNSQPSYLMYKEADGTPFDGEYKGADVERLRVSVTLHYTGDPRLSNGSNHPRDTFISYRLADGKELLNLQLDLSGEKARLICGTNEITLDPNTEYSVIFDINLREETLVLSVKPAGGDAVKLGETTSDRLAETGRFYFRPGNIGHTDDTTAFAIYAKDFSVNTVEFNITNEPTSDCAHNFETEPYVDFEHPANQKWSQTKCTLCGVHYLVPSCEHAGHVPGTQIDSYTAANCTEVSTTTHLCARCGEEVIVEHEAGDHSLTVLLVDVPAGYNFVAFQIVGCEYCKYATCIDGSALTATPGATHTHNFIRNYDYVGEKNYERLECSCGYYYDRLTCEARSSKHMLRADVIASTNSGNCLIKGTETHFCIACYDEITVETATAPHDQELITRIAAADGYEVWMCKVCGTQENIAANHVSGHHFDANNICKCGAVLDSGTVDTSNMVQLACEHDFEEAALVDSKHPLPEAWIRSTCKKCGTYYDRQDCSVVGHIFHIVRYEAVNCLEHTTEERTCLLCGTQEHEDFGIGAHNVTEVLAREPASGTCGGFEILTCSTCNSAQYIEANHDSGHNFDADGKCQCGAEITGESLSSAGTYNLHSTVVNDRISGVNGQFQVIITGTDNVFDGGYNGDPVERIRVTTKIWYTGTPTKSGKNDVLFAVRKTGVGSNEIEVKCDLTGANAKLNGFEMTAGTEYNLIFDFDLKECTIVASIVPVAGGEATELARAKKTPEDMAAIDKIFFRPGNACYCATESDFAFYATKLNVDIVSDVIDESTSMPMSSCAHEFAVQDLVDDAHPAAEEWKIVTCTKCNVSFERKGCDFTGHLLTKFITISPETASAKGYELWGCVFCDEATMVMGNHASGHSFDADDKCACGAVLTLNRTNGVLTYDFSSDSNSLKFSGTSIADGKWNLSATNGQNAYTSIASEFKALLAGEYNGEKLAAAYYSFELSYTGTPAATIDNDFFLWRSTATSGYKDEFFLKLKTESSKLKLYTNVASETLVLEPNVAYKITLRLDHITGKTAAVVTYDLGTGEQSLTLFEITPQYTFDKLMGFWANRPAFYSTDLTVFGLFIDNISLDYAVAQADKSNMLPASTCDHSYTAVDLVDDAHPEGEGWKTVTCEKCNITFARKGCDYMGHVVSKYVSTTAATTTVEGFETWECAFCGEPTQITANHKSGHNFDANDECACGAKIVGEKLGANAITKETKELEISKLTGQPGWSMAAEGVTNPFTGSINDTPVDKVRVSLNLRYTGDPRESDGTAKKDWFLCLRKGGTGLVNLTLDLSGEIAKISADGSKFTDLTAGTVYTIVFDCDLKTGKIVTTITPAGGTAVTLGEATNLANISGVNALICRIGNVGMSTDNTTFAMYVQNVSVDVVEDDILLPTQG